VPWFVAQFKGFEKVTNVDERWSNGLAVKTEPSEYLYKIRLGRILARGDLKPKNYNFRYELPSAEEIEGLTR
jgi:hypothetical protein